MCESKILIRFTFKTSRIFGDRRIIKSQINFALTDFEIFSLIVRNITSEQKRTSSTNFELICENSIYIYIYISDKIFQECRTRKIYAISNWTARTAENVDAIKTMNFRHVITCTTFIVCISSSYDERERQDTLEMFGENCERECQVRLLLRAQPFPIIFYTCEQSVDVDSQKEIICEKTLIFPWLFTFRFQ